ncbi:O-antigen ligase family protein [Thermodesulfobacteriota bacterium]
MRDSRETKGLNCTGQSNLQLIIPLVVVILVLLSIAIMIPSLSTTKTIGLVIGLVIFVISFTSTEIALYILIFSMLLSPEFIVGATEGASLGRGVTLRLDDFILIIIGFSWLAKMSINKELGLFLKTPLNTPIACYIIICLVSTLFGSLFGRVQIKTGFFFVLKYFEYMIIYFMVINHLKSKKQVRNYLWAMLITCAIVSLLAMSQIPGGGRVTAPFEGVSGEPNTLGGYLVLMISVTSGLLLVSASFRDRLIYGVLIIFFSIPLVYTQSRSSYLAIIPAIMTFIFLSEKRNLVIVAVVLIGLSLPFIAPRIAKERISYTFIQGRDRMDTIEIGDLKLDTSTSARIASWKTASKDWIKHPFLGYGVTGYRFVDAQYFRVMTETGFIGLISLFFLIATVFKRAHNTFKKSIDIFEKGLSMGFLAGFVGLLFHAVGANTFIIVRIMEPFWFMTAMVVLVPELREDTSKAIKP